MPLLTKIWVEFSVVGLLKDHTNWLMARLFRDFLKWGCTSDTFIFSLRSVSSSTLLLSSSNLISKTINGNLMRKCTRFDIFVVDWSKHFTWFVNYFWSLLLWVIFKARVTSISCIKRDKIWSVMMLYSKEFSIIDKRLENST